MRRFAVLAVLAVLGPPAAAEPAGGYRFVLEGKEIQPRRIAIEGTADAPAPGDVVIVARHAFTLDEPGEYVLHRTSDQYLSRETPEGSRLIAIGPTWGQEIESLGERAAHLRGVSLIAQPSGALAPMPRVDVARACLTVVFHEEPSAAPDLPPGVTRLRLLGPRDWHDASPRLPLPRRRLLDLVLLEAERISFDLDDLALATGLRHLSAPELRVRDPAALGAFRDLRWLDVSGARDVTDIGFAVRLPALEHLDIDFTRVEDLSPLAGHPGLSEVLARGAPAVAPIPGGLPRLRRLDLRGTLAPPATWAAFEVAHPEARIEWPRAEALRRAVTGCDRLRVRSGGTCHFDEAKERTLWETRKSGEIRELLALLDFDESSSGGACMCCGRPTLEYYAGEELRAMVGVQHGRALRWSGWEGDSRLTRASALAVVEWLAARGVTEPKEEAFRGLRAEQAAQNRWDSIRRVLPGAVFEVLIAKREESEYLGVFRQSAPAPAERARLALRFLGCHEADWNWRDTFDGAAIALLDETPATAVAEAFRGLADDPDAANGAARWLFEEQAHERLAPALVAAATAPAGRAGLAHPGEHSRRRAMNDLRQIGGPAATALLREVLAGTLLPRALDPGVSTSLEGMIRLRREPGDEDAVSDRVLAAVLLSHLLDRGSLPGIEALVAGAADEDRPRVEAALRRVRN